MKLSTWVVLALSVVVLVLAGALTWVLMGNEDSADEPVASDALEKAYDACAAEDPSSAPDDEVSLASMIELEDEGNTITINPPVEGGGELVSYLAVVCVLGRVEAPASVTDPISNTTALMGRQTAEWAEYSMTYSYDPDAGLSATITTN